MLRKFYKLCIGSLLIASLSGCGSLVSQKAAQKIPSSADLPNFSQTQSVGQDDISVAAVSLIGTPYRWGGNTPQGGFDCSGLVVYVLHTVRQQNTPRTSQALGRFGQSLGRENPSPGDLVFFNTSGDQHSHVGIYVGNGRFVHAPTTGGTVRIDAIKTPYWATRYTEARRIKPSD